MRDILGLTWVLVLVHAAHMAFLPLPAGLAVRSDLLQQVEHPDLPPTTLVIGLRVDNVMQSGAGPRSGLFAAPGISKQHGVLVIAVEELDEQRQAAGLTHGDAAVLRARHGQEGARHVVFIMGAQHGQQ